MLSAVKQPMLTSTTITTTSPATMPATSWVLSPVVLESTVSPLSLLSLSDGSELFNAPNAVAAAVEANEPEPAPREAVLVDADAEFVAGRVPPNPPEKEAPVGDPRPPAPVVIVTRVTIPPGPTEMDTGSVLPLPFPFPVLPLRGAPGDEEDDAAAKDNGTTAALGWFGHRAQQAAVVDEPAAPQHHCVVWFAKAAVATLPLPPDEDAEEHGVICALSPDTEGQTVRRQPPPQSDRVHELRLNWTWARPVCASASCSWQRPLARQASGPVKKSCPPEDDVRALFVLLSVPSELSCLCLMRLACRLRLQHMDAEGAALPVPAPPLLLLLPRHGTTPGSFTGEPSRLKHCAAAPDTRPEAVRRKRGRRDVEDG